MEVIHAFKYLSAPPSLLRWLMNQDDYLNSSHLFFLPSFLFLPSFIFFFLLIKTKERRKKGTRSTYPTFERLTRSSLQVCFMSPWVVHGHMALSSCRTGWEISFSWMTVFLAKDFGSVTKEQGENGHWNTTSRLWNFN